MQYIRTVILIFCDCELIPKHQKNNKNKEKKNPCSNKQGGKAIF